MGHLISAHNKSPAGDVASVRIAKQKGSIIRQNRSHIKTNDIVFPEKYFREAIIMKPDIKTGIPTTAGFYDLVEKTGLRRVKLPKTGDIDIKRPAITAQSRAIT